MKVPTNGQTFPQNIIGSDVAVIVSISDQLNYEHGLHLVLLKTVAYFYEICFDTERWSLNARTVQHNAWKCWFFSFCPKN